MKNAKIKNEDNAQAYKKERRRYICNETGKCPLCPMHGGENLRTWKKYGKQKPKYKNKKGQKKVRSLL